MESNQNSRKYRRYRSFLQVRVAKFEACYWLSRTHWPRSASSWKRSLKEMARCNLLEGVGICHWFVLPRLYEYETRRLDLTLRPDPNPPSGLCTLSQLKMSRRHYEQLERTICLFPLLQLKGCNRNVDLLDNQAQITGFSYWLRRLTAWP